MADPLTEIFGRRPFRGTGVVDDYFPEAPDLSYLGRPSFIPRGAGYNPNLDPQGLAAAGLSPRNIMRLQGIRQDLHAQAEQQRMAQDEGSALDALSKIDPANRNFSTQLLDIFRKNPRAQQSPNVMGQVELLSRFAPKTPQWSVEDIEDPDIYDLAVQENWSKLSPAEARRKASRAMMQRQMRGELAGLGLPQKELERDWTQEDYLREKGRLMRESKATSVKPWMERLSDKEAAAVREAATAAKALDDFETEFASVQKDNPGITRDAYVKQFKGDPSFEAYKARRLMDSASSLMQDFGLQPREAASILGLSLPQGGTVPSTSPWEDRTTTGNTEQVPTAPTAIIPPATPTVPAMPASMAAARVSPADLKRVVSAPQALPPQLAPADLKRIDPPTFQSLAQQTQASREAEKSEQARKREEEYLQRQLQQQELERQNTEGMEKSKQELLNRFIPAIQEIRSDTPESHKKFILSEMGLDWNAPAYQAGNSGQTWGAVFNSLLSDPRFAEIRNPTYLANRKAGAANAPKSAQSQVPKEDFSKFWSKP
jgi:hypothetical protein